MTAPRCYPNPNPITEATADTKRFITRLPSDIQDRLNALGSDAKTKFGGMRSVQDIVDRNIGLFEMLIELEIPDKVIVRLLCEVGVTRSDGQRLALSTFTSALSRSRKQLRAGRTEPSPSCPNRCNARREPAETDTIPHFPGDVFVPAPSHEDVNQNGVVGGESRHVDDRPDHPTVPKQPHLTPAAPSDSEPRGQRVGDDLNGANPRIRGDPESPAARAAHAARLLMKFEDES